MPFKTPQIVQVAVGSSATSPPTLRSVGRGSSIILLTAFYRAVNTGASEGPPTTSNPDSGAWITLTGARIASLTEEVGGSCHYLGPPRCGGGDHTITPAANTTWHATAIEVTGLSNQVAVGDGQAGSGHGGAVQNSETTNMSVTANTTSPFLGISFGFLKMDGAGIADVQWTDPPSGGYTTLQKGVACIADVAFIHAYKIIPVAADNTATINWISGGVASSGWGMQGGFTAAQDFPALPAISGGDLYL